MRQSNCIRLMPVSRHAERGNVFMFILLGVVLFAALSFTVARGFRSDTTSSMSEREAELAASEILDYAQRMQRAVSRVLRNGVSENQISFENSQSPVTYPNSNCTNDQCLIFHPDGGGMKWQEPPEGASDFSWNITANHKIPGYGGTGHAGLVLHLPEIDERLCETLNRRLGHDFSSIPECSTNLPASRFINGVFNSGAFVNCDANECREVTSACIYVSADYTVQGGINLGDSYVFYSGIYVLSD